MKAVFEPQPNCIGKLTVEVPAERVAEEREKVIAGFLQAAKLPGFRPGKAPRKAVESRYAKQIEEETRSDILRKTLVETVKDQKINVLSYGQVDGPTPTPEGGLSFVATLIIAPEFELPDYAQIPSDAALKPVEDSDVKDFLERLREPHASFEPVEGRALAMGDFAVISYDATLGGQPLAEAVPGAPAQVCGRRNAWFLMGDNPFMPGFAAAIEGMNVGEEKTFPVTFSAEHPVEALRDKQVDYKATLHAIQSKKLPELDDALAEKIEPGSTLADLEAKVRERLEASAQTTFDAQKRQAAVQFLLSKVEFELPEAFVNREMRGMLRDIVRENQARGISDEELKNHQDEIVGAAQQGAKERVRTNFLLLKIAEKEKIEVTEADLTSLVVELSHRYEIPLKKFVSEIRKRGGVDELREQVLARKALDLLSSNVTVASQAAPAAA